ncbi:hypothetical protein [Erythrobacter sp.]|uniref:hypothetical protein n=1 Tax=Erythrobacter sp. TaxID=1042 RepID=UPI0025FA3D28|nr:hypothetical protein [Erythrobacter sp.]
MTDDVRLRDGGAGLAGASLAFWFCDVFLGANHADKGAYITMVGMMACLILIRRRRAQADAV